MLGVMTLQYFCLYGCYFQVSGEIPCATPDNQSVRTTSGPLGPAERNVHSSPYIDPRHPGSQATEFEHL